MTVATPAPGELIICFLSGYISLVLLVEAIRDDSLRKELAALFFACGCILTFFEIMGVVP